jgi:hypothetical protein
VCRVCFTSLRKPRTCPICRSHDINEEAETFTAFLFQGFLEEEPLTLWDMFNNPEFFEDGEEYYTDDDERSANSGDDMTAEQLEEQNRQLIENLAEPFEPVRDDPHLFPQPEPEDYPEGDSDY